VPVVIARELAAVLGAGLLVLLCTPVVRRVAVQTGAMDEPGARRVHTTPTPRLGGVAIVAAVLITLFLIGHGMGMGPPVEGIMLGGALIAAVGLADDLYCLPPWLKLVGQVVAASVAVSWGVQVRWVTDPFGGMIHLGVWTDPLTVLWIVALANMINLIDGLDGLAAGLSAIAAVTMLVVANLEGAATVALLAAVLAGACLAFLRYNFHPASIFMGDTGALFLGYMLATTAVVGTLKNATTMAIAVPILALGIPVFDTALAILRRLLTRRPIGEADAGHVHHRLLGLGLSQPQVVVLLYLVSIGLGTAGLLMTQVSARTGVAVLGIVTGLFFGGAHALGLLRVRPARAVERPAETPPPPGV
jgi:UDP-GlcNAc:undecaprenyl-phosphate GlcNAc-1-phosphate transferase